MQVYFRVPHPKNLNFEADLPGIPRIGEDVDSAQHGTFTVERVVWFLDEDNSSPYVILK
jgi:hypothetical protein